MLLVSAAALINSNEEVLIAKRPSGTFMSGFWEFPGGKIENGETPEEALRREIQEELAITLGSFQPLTFISEKRPEHHVVVFLYLCREWQGVPVGLQDQELKWVLPRNLPEISDMLPSNKQLVIMLRNHFGFKSTYDLEHPSKI
jgi:8-oxo-dGTP diphosphatase